VERRISFAASSPSSCRPLIAPIIVIYRKYYGWRYALAITR